ncbi:hypothetical protein [Candidatus Nitrospira bockiana]
MRKQLAMLATATLLGAGSVAGAESYRPSDESLQPGMSMAERQDATQDAENSETVTAEIVDIDGDRLITETDEGEHLVFLVEGSADDFNVGDELELKLDDQAKRAVILNVRPQQDEDKAES